jgi:hypothetical protein
MTLTLLAISSALLAGCLAAPYLQKEARQWRVEYRVRKSLRRAVASAATRPTPCCFALPIRKSLQRAVASAAA